MITDSLSASAIADGAASLAAALDYRSRGWPVLALCSPDHAGMTEGHCTTCRQPGKCPWHHWTEFQPDGHGRLPTLREVNKFWRQHPNSNVGMPLGAALDGVPGLRADLEGPEARGRLVEMCGGDLPDTLTFSSGRGDGTGEGLLFALPPGIRLFSSSESLPLGGEVRLQALGAQTVLPPSRHWSGRLYAWLSGRGPGEVPLAIAPPGLLEYLRTPGRDRRRQAAADRPRRVGGTEADIAVALAALVALRARRAQEYDDWLKVGMALHWVDQGEEMLTAWDQWSKRCPEKYEDGACECKWNTFSVDGSKKGKPPVTLASLIYWAKEDGWEAPARAPAGAGTGTAQCTPVPIPSSLPLFFSGCSDTPALEEYTPTLTLEELVEQARAALPDGATPGKVLRELCRVMQALAGDRCWHLSQENVAPLLGVSRRRVGSLLAALRDKGDLVRLTLGTPESGRASTYMWRGG